MATIRKQNMTINSMILDVNTEIIGGNEDRINLETLIKHFCQTLVVYIMHYLQMM